MKDFLLVFRVLYRNRSAVAKESNGGKRKLTSQTVMMLSLLPMVAVICVMLGFVAAELTTRYSAMTLLNAILSAVQLFILFMTLPTVLGTLYSSEDAAFLAALPLRPVSVFFAKLLVVYITALKIAAVLLIPSVLTVSVTYSAFGNPMFYGFFPLIAVIVLAAPLLPLFIVVLFSMPVVWIGSRLKGRAVIKTVLSLVFYILLMAAYMVLVFFINTEGFGQNGTVVSDAALEGLRLLSDVMYPNSVLISMCLGMDAAVNFGIGLAIWSGITALTVLFALLFYKKISSSRAESPAEESSPRRQRKPLGMTAALIKKDLLSVMRDPSAAMGMFSNVVLAPIVMAVMFFFMQGDGDRTMSEFAGDMMMRGIVLLYPIVFLSGTNMVAMTAYSREGESFFISKFLPIPPKTSVRAKLTAFLPHGRGSGARGHLRPRGDALRDRHRLRGRDRGRLSAVHHGDERAAHLFRHQKGQRALEVAGGYESGSGRRRRCAHTHDDEHSPGARGLSRPQRRTCRLLVSHPRSGGCRGGERAVYPPREGHPAV